MVVGEVTAHEKSPGFIATQAAGGREKEIIVRNVLKKPRKLKDTTGGEENGKEEGFRGRKGCGVADIGARRRPC